jgi:hypothetical protein
MCPDDPPGPIEDRSSCCCTSAHRRIEKVNFDLLDLRLPKYIDMLFAFKDGQEAKRLPCRILNSAGQLAELSEQLKLASAHNHPNQPAKPIRSLGLILKCHRVEDLAMQVSGWCVRG